MKSYFLLLWTGLLLSIVLFNACEKEVDPLEDRYGAWKGLRGFERYDDDNEPLSYSVIDLRLSIEEDQTGTLELDNGFVFYNTGMYWSYLEEQNKMLISVIDSSGVDYTYGFVEYNLDIIKWTSSDLIMRFEEERDFERTVHTWKLKRP